MGHDGELLTPGRTGRARSHPDRVVQAVDGVLRELLHLVPCRRLGDRHEEAAERGHRLADLPRLGLRMAFPLGGEPWKSSHDPWRSAKTLGGRRRLREARKRARRCDLGHSSKLRKVTATMFALIVIEQSGTGSGEGGCIDDP